MKKADTLTSSTPRRKMPAEVFVKIWKGEMEVAGTEEWGNLIKLRNDISGTLTQVEFSDIEVVGNIKIEENRILLPHLEISNCSLTNCFFSHAKTRFIRILENTTIQCFNIEKSTTEYFWIWGEVGSLTIMDSTTGNLEISGATIDSLSILKSTIGNLTVGSSKLKHLSVQSASRLSNLSVWELDIEKIFVCGKSYVGHLQLSFSLRQPSRIILENCYFGHIDLNSSVFSEFTTMNVLGCEVNQVSLKNFCNYGTLFFSSLNPLEKWDDFKKDEIGKPVFSENAYQFESVEHPSTLRLTDSDLGKIQFINCDLRKIKRFEFVNTKMLEIFTAGTQMPTDKAFCLPNNEQNPSKIVKQKRLAYGQIKKLFEARGNSVGSLIYLGYEMEAYRKQLQMEGWWKNRGDLFMLWMNKLSTYYGISWQRGLAAITIAMIFFYSIFCYLIGYRFENDSPDDVDRFWKLVSYAPYYLNPLRDLDSVSLVKEEEFTPMARIWDFISRIFVAYFVYQTIQAFRKLGKSSG